MKERWQTLNKALEREHQRQLKDHNKQLKQKTERA